MKNKRALASLFNDTDGDGGFDHDVDFANLEMKSIRRVREAERNAPRRESAKMVCSAGAPHTLH
jgi:hypothetical protein